MALFRRRQLLRLVSWLGAALVVILAGATLWNAVGPVGLGDASDVARGRFSEGRLAGHEIDARGAALAAHWIETRTEPTTDPLRILWQQLKYNAWTRGYDLVLWLEAEDLDMSSPMFALYQSGRTLFLRIEYKGKNRVLDASFDAAELEEALEPYLKAR